MRLRPFWMSVRFVNSLGINVDHKIVFPLYFQVEKVPEDFTPDSQLLNNSSKGDTMNFYYRYGSDRRQFISLTDNAPISMTPRARHGATATPKSSRSAQTANSKRRLSLAPKQLGEITWIFCDHRLTACLQIWAVLTVTATMRNRRWTD